MQWPQRSQIHQRAPRHHHDLGQCVRRIIWIRYCHLENIRTADSCGCSTYRRLRPRASTWSICKTNLTRNSKSARRERRVFVRSEKNFTRKHLTNSFAKSQSTALNADSSWSASAMKSKWQCKLIKPFTNPRSPTECVKLCRPNNGKPKCWSKLINWMRPAKILTKQFWNWRKLFGNGWPKRSRASQINSKTMKLQSKHKMKRI